MATLDTLRTLALQDLAAGDFARALRLHAHMITLLPHDLDARMRVADMCVRLGQLDPARQVYAAVAYLDLQAGRPLHALVAMQALADLGEDVDPLREALSQLYGAGSPRVARVGARLSPPAEDTEIEPPPDRSEELPVALSAAVLAAADTSTLREFPARFQPVPLLSDLSDRALRRVLQCAVVRRLVHGTAVLRQGDPGDAFYFLAAGQLRVHRRDEQGNDQELARLYEGAIFGEMALIRAEPRSASIEVVGSADLVEFGRDAIRAAADELPALAASLDRFTRDRLVKNLAATSPLFAPFEGAERAEFLKRFQEIEIGEGDELVARGTALPGLYVVVSGELEVLQGSTPAQGTATRLGPGDCLGQHALLEDRAATATVRAAKRASLLLLPREYFDRLMLTVPEIKSWLAGVTEERRRRLGDGAEDLLV